MLTRKDVRKLIGQIARQMYYEIPFNSDNYNMFVAMPNVHGQYGTDTKP